MTPEERESKLCLARERVNNCDPARVLTDEEEEWLDRLPCPPEEDCSTTAGILDDDWEAYEETIS